MFIRPLIFATVFAVTGCATENLDELGSTESAVNIADFKLPTLSAETRATIVRAYDLLDPQNMIPRGLLEDAMIYFDVNKAHIPMTDYFTVVDLSRHSGKDRFWLIELATGTVESHKVAHGDGSDPDNNGTATLFGNVDGSHKSSLGFYLTGEIYDGNHPHSMRLDGLTVNNSRNGMANSNARSRFIVVHEASYVNDASTSQQGRSNGCLALDPDIEAGVVDRIHDGSLIYVATKQLDVPVGRATCGDGTCDGSETESTCAEDCTMDAGSGSDSPADRGDAIDDLDQAGGCSTGGGTGLMVAVALAGLGVRRRRRISVSS